MTVKPFCSLLLFGLLITGCVELELEYSDENSDSLDELPSTVSELIEHPHFARNALAVTDVEVLQGPQFAIERVFEKLGMENNASPEDFANDWLKAAGQMPESGTKSVNLFDRWVINELPVLYNNTLASQMFVWGVGDAWDRSFDEGFADLNFAIDWSRIDWDWDHWPTVPTPSDNCGDALFWKKGNRNREDTGNTPQFTELIFGDGSRMPKFIPTGIFNRLDLADEQTCGQFRIVYSAQEPQEGYSVVTNSKIIFEGVLPRLEADPLCRGILEQVAKLSSTPSVSQKTNLLEDIYFDGIAGYSPVVSAANYSENGGQIRTLDKECFMQFEFSEGQLERTVLDNSFAVSAANEAVLRYLSDPESLTSLLSVNSLNDFERLFLRNPIQLSYDSFTPLPALENDLLEVSSSLFDSWVFPDSHSESPVVDKKHDYLEAKNELVEEGLSEQTIRRAVNHLATTRCVNCHGLGIDFHGPFLGDKIIQTAEDVGIRDFGNGIEPFNVLIGYERGESVLDLSHGGIASSRSHTSSKIETGPNGDRYMLSPSLVLGMLPNRVELFKAMAKQAGLLD